MTEETDTRDLVFLLFGPTPERATITSDVPISVIVEPNGLMWRQCGCEFSVGQADTRVTWDSFGVIGVYDRSDCKHLMKMLEDFRRAAAFSMEYCR